MNTRNGFIAVAVVLILLLTWYIVWNNSSTSSTGVPVATTTPNGGAASTPPVPATSAGLPGVQTGSLAVPSNTGAVVTGYVAPNGPATTYWFDYGPSGSLTSRTAVKTVSGGFVTLATPAFISGLSANTSYSYRMSAQNSFGAVQGATYTFTTTSTAPAGSKPAATTNAASQITRVAGTLNGRVDPNGAQTTYWFEYGPTQGFGNTTAFGSVGDGTDALAVAIPAGSLTAATKYYYRLNAQNVHGTVNGETQSFTTQGPAAAGLPTVNTTAATNVATSSATLNGRVNPHNAASSYWFEYGTNPLLTSILGTVSATQTLPGEATTNVSVDVKGLSTNTKYYFRLVARNPQGTSVSEPASFTTRR